MRLDFVFSEPDATIRDSKEAIAIAEEAVLIHRRSQYMDTLAAAFAENGQFDKAIKLQQEAIDHLSDDIQLEPSPNRRKEYVERLNAYTHNKTGVQVEAEHKKDR